MSAIRQGEERGVWPQPPLPELIVSIQDDTEIARRWLMLCPAPGASSKSGVRVRVKTILMSIFQSLRKIFYFSIDARYGILYVYVVFCVSVTVLTSKQKPGSHLEARSQSRLCSGNRNLTTTIDL
jgi:hypothetical protein